MMEAIKEFFDVIIKLILSVQWYDIADVLFVAFLLYYCLKLLRETRAFNLIKGVVLVGIVYLIVSSLNMAATTLIFNSLLGDIVFVMILLFQPEIRHAIEAFGRGDFKKINFFISKRSDYEKEELKASASNIAKAALNMSEKKVGALIVVEGKTPLGEVLSSGTKIDSLVTTPILENIFFPKAPLHDGAVIIRDNKIHSAGCILPLTQNEVSFELGTRHRAALGMSESSDALVVVVSEETGTISIAQNGTLERNLKLGELTQYLTDYIVADSGEKPTVLSRLSRRKK